MKHPIIPFFGVNKLQSPSGKQLNLNNIAILLLLLILLLSLSSDDTTSFVSNASDTTQHLSHQARLRNEPCITLCFHWSIGKLAKKYITQKKVQIYLLVHSARFLLSFPRINEAIYSRSKSYLFSLYS